MYEESGRCAKPAIYASSNSIQKLVLDKDFSICSVILSKIYPKKSKFCKPPPPLQLVTGEYIRPTTYCFYVLVVFHQI